MEEYIVDQLVKDTQQTYYEYVSKIEQGCIQIATDLRVGNNDAAFKEIINLTEGFGWLLDVEAHMLENSYKVNSRLAEALDFLNEASDALEGGDTVTVADLFEYELAPLFSSATEWTFSEITN